MREWRYTWLWWGFIPSSLMAIHQLPTRSWFGWRMPLRRKAHRVNSDFGFAGWFWVDGGSQVDYRTNHKKVMRQLTNWVCEEKSDEPSDLYTIYNIYIYIAWTVFSCIYDCLCIYIYIYTLCMMDMKETAEFLWVRICTFVYPDQWW